MRIHTLLLFIFLFFFAQHVASGNSNYQLLLQKTIPVQRGYFTTDPIGNIYLVRDNNFIVKYNSNGDSLAVFNDISSGNITLIDATNPLLVLVFYSGFSQIRILDNLLSEKNQLDLKRIGLFNIPAIANSMDGNIWIYDPVGELKKIDDRLEVVQSYPLRNMVDFVVNPCHMVENERILYMTDSTEGILQFDRYGFYQTVYRFITQETEVMNDYIVYYKSGELISYNKKTLRELRIELPRPANIINARLEKELVYILRPDKLEIYRLQQH